MNNFGRNLLPVILGMCLNLGLNGCGNSQYIRNLESSVKENNKTVLIEKENQEEKGKEIIPFEYSSQDLNVAESRKVHLEIYTSKSQQNVSSNIVLIPTLGEPATSLNKFSSEMASYGHNVFCLDVEGFGKSSGERGKIDIRKIEEDISKTIEFTRTKSDKKIVLCGGSIGGEYVLIYGAEGKYKNNIEAIIAQGFFMPSVKTSDFDFKMEFCQTDLGESLVELFAGKHIDIVRQLGKKHFYNDEKKFKEIEEDPDYVTQIVTKSHMEFLQYKPSMPLTSYGGKVLLIASRNDYLVPLKRSINLCSEFRKRNSKAGLCIPQGKETGGNVPHMALDTNYRELAREVNSFLRDTKK